MQELEYSVLQNKVDALSNVVKNNEETQVRIHQQIISLVQVSYYFLQYKAKSEKHRAS